MTKARRKPSLPDIDRRLAEADKPFNGDVAARAVDDPFSTEGHKIAVSASLRDDPLARLHVRRQITDAQFNAGRRLQSLFEASQIGSVKAIDPGKEAVDGGRCPEPLTDRQAHAAAELAEVRYELGSRDYALVWSVLGDRQFIEQYARATGVKSQRTIDFLSRSFRDALERCAKLWGARGKPIKQPDPLRGLSQYRDNPELFRAIHRGRYEGRQ